MGFSFLSEKTERNYTKKLVIKKKDFPIFLDRYCYLVCHQ